MKVFLPYLRNGCNGFIISSLGIYRVLGSLNETPCIFLHVRIHRKTKSNRHIEVSLVNFHPVPNYVESINVKVYIHITHREHRCTCFG